MKAVIAPRVAFPKTSARRAGLVAVITATVLQAATAAQQSPTPAVTVSPNVNVLRNVSDPLLGDAFLQRQNEPVVAISTRNPDHMMIAANDYRTVDISSDTGIGEVFAQLIRGAARFAESVIARLTGRSAELAEEEERERAEAGTEAWIGLYVTNDRGRNWTNAWMPGYPQDTSAAGKASPAYGKQAASDPVLAAAPAGRFYLGAMAFDRGGSSKIVVSRLTDRNNSEKGNNFHFDLMREVDAGPAGLKFLDKPAIVADIARKSSDPGACGPVYIGYTVFDDRITDPMDRSRILVSTSLDCGNTWMPPRKVNLKSKLVQGVTLGIRPSDGRLYAAYRDFAANNIYVTWADDNGYTFAPPVKVSETMVPFDQPTLGSPDFAFRTNAFPTLTIASDNTVYVAWQERLAANGNPRIVVTTSIDGNTWTAKRAVESDRCVIGSNGAQSCGVLAGPQVMPSLTFSRGRVMLLFYEARPGADDVKWVASQNASYITGLDVQLFLRVAQLDSTGKGVSAIATQYEADKDGKPLPLIASDGSTEYRGANRPNLPMYQGGKSPFIGDYISVAPSMPFVRATISAAAQQTTTADTSSGFGFFKADARLSAGTKDAVPFWRWATERTDGPTAAFQAVWTDNRDVFFPRNSAGLPRIDGDWSQYAPPGFGPCINPGSRNANVYTAEIAPRLVAGSPTTFKQLGIQRAFVIYLQNRTTDRKFYRMTVVDTPEANGSFLQRPPDVNLRDVEIFPLSTVTDTVYVTGSLAATQPVRVDVVEIDRQGGVPVAGGESATVLFNSDNSNPSLDVADPSTETHTPKLFTPGNPHSLLPKISNPQLANPQLANPQLANPQLANPQLANPQLANLQLTNSPYADPTGDVVQNVTNYTWQFTNAGSTASAFTPVFNIANQAKLAGKKTRLYIYNTYKTPAFIQTPNGCTAVEQPRDVVISVIDNPQLANPQLANPQLANPQLANPQLANSTFYVAPSDSVSSTGTAAAAWRNVIQNIAFQAAAPTDADLTIAIPPPDTFITLSIQDGDTFQVGPPPPPPAPGEPPPPSDPPLTLEDFSGGEAALGVVSSAAAVINGVIQPIVESVSTSADLVFSSTPTIAPLSLQAGGLVTVSSFDVTVVGNTSTAASGFRYGFYLSTTVEINPSTAVFLGSMTHEGAIAPGEVVTLTGGTFAIPPSTTPGQYYVGVFLNDGQLHTPPLNPYLFESFGNDTVSMTLTIAAPVGPAPTATSDSALTNEDATLNVAAPGVLGNDGNAGGVTAVLSLGATHGTVTLNANGSYTYVPNANYYGPDSFTYYATNGTLASTLATVSITVQPVNDVPSFTVGPDQTVSANGSLATVPNWATNISAGPSNESGQALNFVVSADNAALFTQPPAVSPTGTLTFVSGTNGGSTAVHVSLHDDGTTANGGADTSAAQTFTITLVPTTSANLGISQVRSPANPTVGSVVTYTVTVTNDGPDAATDVTVSDLYPTGLSWLSVTPSVGTCSPGDFGNFCSLGTLASGATATITMTYTANDAQPVTHTVSVSSSASDPVSSNNTSSDLAMVVFPPCAASEFQGPYFTSLTGFSAGVLAVADFNSDGLSDVAITEATANQIAIALGGTATPLHVAVGSNPSSISAGDFDNDGNPDLVVANGGSANVSVLLGNGSGGFAPAVNYSVPVSPFSTDVGDLNGDGNLDLVIGYAGATSTTIAVLLGNGAGGFGQATTYPSGQSPLNVIVADFDGDGKLDVAVPNTGTNNIALLKGDGSGALAAPAFIALPEPVQRLRYLGDVDNDGRPDLGVTTGASGVPLNLMLLRNTGGGSFAPAVEIIPHIGIGFTVPGDFNKDGKIDLAAINFPSGRVLVLLGDGTGGFPTSVGYAVNATLNHLVIADTDGDGRLDIVGSSRGAFYTLLNTCGAPLQSDLTVTATAPANVANGGSFTLTATVTNNGPAVASQVRMSHALASGVSYVGVNGQGLCTELNGTVSCDVPSLAVGATATFSIDVQAYAAGVRISSVSATSPNTDPNPADNYAEAATAIAAGPMTFVVTTTADAGPGTLRQAMTDSNMNASSTNTIAFAIPGSAPFTISPASQLPTITSPAVIDGTSQSGFGGTPVVVLDGVNVLGQGIVINASGSTIRGVTIKGFSANGILIQNNGSNNTIGGTSPGAGNVIINNVGKGVAVNSGTGNAIRQNTISDNGGVGIDLGTTGVTSNDTGDGDSGPNNLQNFPVLTVAQVVGGGTTVSGTLNSAGNATYGIDIFANSACDPSGNGEGQRYLGSLQTSTDGTGNASFSTTVTGVAIGEFITATATDASGNTSEFSACRSVVTGIVATDLFAGSVLVGETSSGFVGLDAHHDGGPVPTLFTTVNLTPGGKPNLSLPGPMAILPAVNGEPGIGYFQATGRIGILDLATRQIVGDIEQQFQTAATVARANATTRFAYFVGGNRLFAVDGRSSSPTYNQVVWSTLIGTTIRTLVVNETTNRLYVFSQSQLTNTTPFSSQVTAIDVNPSSPTFHQVLGSAPVSSSGVNDVALNAATNKMYVADGNGMRVVNGLTLTVTTVAGVTATSSIAVNPVKNMVYASNGFNQIFPVNSATDTLLTPVTLPTNGGPGLTGEGRLVIHNTSGRVFYRYGDGPQSSRLVTIDGDPANVATFNTLVAQASAGWETSPSFIAIDQPAARLAVTTAGRRETTVIDALTSLAVATVVAPQTSTRPIAIDPTTHFAYVLMSIGGIQAIDLTTAGSQIVHTGTEVRTPVVDPTSHVAFVPRTGTDTALAVVDGTGLLSVVNAPNGTGQFRFAERNSVTNRIYVTNFGANAAGNLDAAPGAVSVIDGSSRSLLTTIPVGNRPNGIAINEVLNKIYVGNTSVSNDVSANYQTWAGITVIDGVTNSVTPANLSAIAASALSIQQALAVNPTTGRLYFRIASGASTTIGYLDGATNVGLPLPASLGPVSIIRVNPVLNRIYIGATDTKVHVLDGSTHAELATIPVGSPSTAGAAQNWIAVNRVTGRVYIADRNADSVSIVDGQTNSILKTFNNLDGPVALAVSEATNRVYVANSDSRSIMIIDGTTMNVIGGIELPLRPLVMAVDDTITPTQIYATAECSPLGCGDDSAVMVVSDPIDPNGPVTVSSVSQAAHGTVVINADGSLSYTSNSNYVGPDSFTYTVTDAHGAVGTGTITLNVRSATTITTTSLPSTTVGQPYAYTVTAAGGTGPYNWTIRGGQLPAGLALNEATGAITGTATTSGTYSVTIEVADAEGEGTSATFPLIVGPPAIITNLPNPTINTQYSQQLFVGGATGAITWALNTQNSPLLSWLSLSASGLLTGTPQNYGTLPSFIVTATDANNQVATRTYTLSVGGPLDVVPTTLREGVVLETQPALPIVGGNGTKSATITSGTLPPGVTMSTTGAFSGTPTAHGTFNFTVQVQDCTPASSCASGVQQQTVTRSITWRVSAREQQGGTTTSSPLTFGGSGGRKIAQTFTVGAWGKLTGIGPTNTTCSLLGPLTVEVQRQTASGLPDGVTIATGLATSNFGAIALSPALNVGVDERLAFVLSSPTPCTITNAPTTDSYQAGEAFADSGSGWTPLIATADAKYDIPFRSLLQPVVSLGYLINGRSNTARAVMLNNGKILFTGTNNTAEIYDPATSLSTATGNMTIARSPHSATLLADGKVLIAGGRDSAGNYLTSAETFDPATGTFTATAGNLATARGEHTATLLPNGKVLIVAGLNVSGPSSVGVQTAELYDPATRTFSPAGATLAARWVHTATVLNDGRILLAGGFSSSGTASAELYDPNTGTFTATTGSMVQWRGQHRAVLLDDGRVLIVGGQYGDVQLTAEIFDPTSSTFSPTGSMSVPRQMPAAVRLNDGSVLAAGGLTETGVNSYTLAVPSMERFLPGSGSFVRAGSMVARRFGAAPIALGNTILLAGGSSQSWLTTNSIESYQLGSIPALETTSLPDGQLNVAYGPVTLTASGGSGAPYQILQISGALPPGMAYNAATSTLSGTPTASGVFTLGFEIIDNALHENQQSLTLKVSALTITSPYRLTDGAIGSLYSLPLTASAPATWSIPQGSSTLPPGLNLSASGLISGTPTAVGYYNFIVRAVDGTGQAASKVLSINIRNPLAITTTLLPEAVLWDSYGRCVSTTNGIGPLTFQVVSGTPPPGVTLPSSGCFTGTTSGTGTYGLTVQVTDSSTPPQTASAAFSMRASAPDLSYFASATTNPQAIGQTSQRSVARTFTVVASGTLTAAQVWGLACPSSPTVQVSARLFRASPVTGQPMALLTTGSGDWYDPIKFVSPQAVGQGEQYAVEFLIGSADCTIATPTTVNWIPGDAWEKIGNGTWQRMVGLDVPFRTLIVPSQPFSSLSTWRGGVAAAATANGKILITGGANSADLYDPVANIVDRTTGNMAAVRTYHTATPIGSGKVLIAGGYDSNGPSQTAEVYDPAAGTFTATANNMTVARAQHTATVLSDGRVLIAGGLSTLGGTASVDIYDPATNQFSPAANMTGTRWSHTANLLNDGRVLIVGGNSNGPFPVANGEVYDPVLNAFVPTAEPITPLRSRHTSMLLSDGRVLIVGGTKSYPALEPTTEIYDPTTNRLTAGPPMLVPRMEAVVANNLIIGGMASDAFGQDALSEVERYSFSTGTFEFAGNLVLKRHAHAAVPFGSDKVIVVGGYGASPLTGRTLEVYGPTPVPALDPFKAPDGQSGASYGPYTFNISGTAPFQLGFSTGTVPDGVGFAANTSGGNSTGFTLAGVPTAIGTFPFNVVVSDGLGQQRTQPFRVRIDPVIITTTQLAQGTSGQFYSQSLAATSIHGPLTWTVLSSTGAEVTSGAGLPPGISVNSAGLVSGTPGASGFYTFNVRVRDSLGQSATAIVALFIQ